MENNNIEDIEYEQTRKTGIYSILYYFIFMYFIAVIIQIILMGVAPVITGVDLLLPNTENELHPINELFILSWTQIVVYIGLTIGLICLTKKYLVKHFVNFLQNRKSLSLEFLIGFGIFWGATILSNLLLELLNIEGDSTNQEIIISILNGDYKWIVTFILVILGPLCEEIIFRHSFFSVFKKNTNKWIKILISGAIFGGIHFVTAIINYINMDASITVILEEIVLGLSYIVSGIALGYIYTRCKENLVPVLLIHILNNAIAAVEIFIS